MAIQTSNPNRILRPIVLSVFLTAIGAVGIIAYAAAKHAPIYFGPPAGENIIYLASSVGTVDSDLPESPGDLQKQGVAIVYTFADLISAARSQDHPVDAIVFHASRLKDVDQEWLQSMYHHAVVIGAVDVTVRDLAAAVGNNNIVNDDTWTNGWQKPPFYSILAYKLKGSPEEQQLATRQGIEPALLEASTDNIVSRSDVDVFFSLIRRDIADLRSEDAPEPTRSRGSN